MKCFLIASLFLFANSCFSQKNEQSKTIVVNYDSTYCGPRLGTGSKKFVGNLRGKTEYNFANLWSQVTPENSGKWESIGITPDTTIWNWEPVTKLYNYAKANKMQFKFHTLIWGRQQPVWISDLKPEEQLDQYKRIFPVLWEHPGVAGVTFWATWKVVCGRKTAT